MVTVRQATPADAEAIAEIHTTARREAMPWLPVLHTDAETRVWVAEVVLVAQQVWVAEVDGQVVGYIGVSDHDLNDLYVRPGWQRQGIGTVLLEQARAVSPDRLELWAFKRNAGARRFYERHGFVAIGETDGAGNEEREPDVRYRWVRASEVPGR
jgi:GNAT superfamily N-acetyltransferase